MKSMTDFIMEQEMPSVEEEVFNEAALVSQFMAVQAAAAEMNCIYEYASIATFCESNDIEMPEMLVQEGFKERMNKIWTGISNFFKKIADWFKSLVKGTVSTFSSAKLNEIIAKLKTYDESTELTEMKVVYPAAIYLYIVAALEAYREVVIAPFAEGQEFKDANDAEKFAKDFIENIDKFTADLEALKDSSKWKTAEGGLKTDFKFEVLDKYADTSKVNIALRATDMGKDTSDKQTLKYGWLINVLETVNRLDVPKQGSKILSELNVDINKFKTAKATTKTVPISANKGDDIATVATNAGVDKTNLTNAINTKSTGAIANTGKFSRAINDTFEVADGVKWVADKDVQDKVGKTANLLATVYDKAKQGLSDTTALVFKDLKKAEGEDADKEYQNALKDLNADTGRGRLSKSNSAFSDDAKKNLGFGKKNI